MVTGMKQSPMTTTSRTIDGTASTSRRNDLDRNETAMTTLIYGIPLTACISLVYCATRYELPERILRSAAGFFIKTLIGLAVLYAILWFFST